MHPDEATGEILLSAKQQNKSYAVVPCCVVGRYSEPKMSYLEWVKKLKGLFNCQERALDIRGCNIVLYDKTRR